MPRNTLKSAPKFLIIRRVDRQLVHPVRQRKVADSAEMAAYMPITWATMAGQDTPPLRQ